MENVWLKNSPEKGTFPASVPSKYNPRSLAGYPDVPERVTVTSNDEPARPSLANCSEGLLKL